MTQQCHPDRAKRRGISNNDKRDVSTTVDMTPTRFFSIWVNSYIIALFFKASAVYFKHSNDCEHLQTDVVFILPKRPV